MANRLDAYLSELERNERPWKARVARPYVIAYADAYDRFTTTFEEEERRQRAQAELFVLATSVATGSLLLASAGTSSLRVLAGRAALYTISHSSLRQTYSLIAGTAVLDAGLFAVNKVLDHVSSEVGKQVRNHLATLNANGSNIISNAPFIQYMQMENFFDEHYMCAENVAREIEADPAMSSHDKDRAFAVLRQAPIVNAPTGSFDQARLSQHIELSMYMAAVLDSDRITEFSPRATISMAPAVVQSSRSIEEMPGAPNYPRPEPRRFGLLTQPGFEMVHVESLGRGIERKIDELHEEIFDEPFYPSRGQPGQRLRAGLHKAEGTLNALAARMRPRSPNDVRLA